MSRLYSIVAIGLLIGVGHVGRAGFLPGQRVAVLKRASVAVAASPYVVWDQTFNMTTGANGGITVTANLGGANTFAYSTTNTCAVSEACSVRGTIVSGQAFIGLTESSATHDQTGIRYALYSHGSGTLFVFENGSPNYSFGGWSIGDVFEVRSNGTTVSYYHNGVHQGDSAISAAGLTLFPAASGNDVGHGFSVGEFSKP